MGEHPEGAALMDGDRKSHTPPNLAPGELRGGTGRPHLQAGTGLSRPPQLQGQPSGRAVDDPAVVGLGLTPGDANQDLDRGPLPAQRPAADSRVPAADLLLALL